MKLLRNMLRALGWWGEFAMEVIKKLPARAQPALADDSIPCDQKGAPDLACYTEPLQHYIDLYNSFLSTYHKRLTPQQQRLAWSQRVHGEWGILAKGQEALPFLLTLLRHPNPDAREDSSFLLGKLKQSDDISGQLLYCLQNEKDLVVLSAIMKSLGKLRYRPAIPALASLILDMKTNIDTRWDAVDSLSGIVGEEFSEPDKLQKAEAWLTAHPNHVNQPVRAQSSAVLPITRSQV